MSTQTRPALLRRELGLWGAIMMGMGSIVGTGVFVSIGITAGVAGPAVIVAVVVAALVAACNGLSSAQLAASHAVSGGTYEYGYRYLTPWLGFTAGWMFLLAKSASAATAALGFAGYLLNVFGGNGQRWLVGIALVAVGVLTLIVLSGIRRSNLTNINIVVVSVTLGALVFFVLAGLPVVIAKGGANFTPFFYSPAANDGSPCQGLLHASALMFVACTGYGRIATMGEEVREPRQIIPRAIIITMALTMLLYTAVAVVGIGTVGGATLSEAATQQAVPLVAAHSFVKCRESPVGLKRGILLDMPMLPY